MHHNATGNIRKSSDQAEASAARLQGCYGIKMGASSVLGIASHLCTVNREVCIIPAISIGIKALQGVGANLEAASTGIHLMVGWIVCIFADCS